MRTFFASALTLCLSGLGLGCGSDDEGTTIVVQEPATTGAEIYKPAPEIEVDDDEIEMEVDDDYDALEPEYEIDVDD